MDISASAAVFGDGSGDQAQASGDAGGQAGGKTSQTKQLLLTMEEKPMMDEFVALYIGMQGGRSLEQKFRESIGASQDDGAYHLTKSGEFNQYALRNLQTLFRNNEDQLGKGQNAQQAAVYSKLFKGGEARDYEESFCSLKTFIELSLDEVKSELHKVLFPVFVCLFLNMVLKKMPQAQDFLTQHKHDFLPHHKNDVAILETVHDLQRLEDPEVSKYLKTKFYVKISRHSYTLLKYQVDFNQLNLIMHIMNLNIHFEITSEPDIVVDSKCQESILLYDYHLTPGVGGGDSSFSEKVPLNLGRLKEFYPEAWETTTAGDKIEAEGGKTASSTDNAAKDASSAAAGSLPSQSRTDDSKSAPGGSATQQAGFAPGISGANASSITVAGANQTGANMPRKTKRGLANIIQKQIPLPELEKELQDLINSEFRQQVRLTEKQLPSIGSINLLNTYRQLNCTCLSDSGDLMATGMADSTIKVFWLNQESLKRSLNLGKYLNINLAQNSSQKQSEAAISLQQSVNLNQPHTVLSKDGLKIQLLAEQMANKEGLNLTEQNLSVFKTKQNQKVLDLRPEFEEQKLLRDQSQFVLVGHSGPVFAIDVSLDDKYLISGSYDCTVRRWSIQTRTCLIVYNGHQFPVWNVKFGPLGYYFASCSNDRTACVWNMRQHTPVRILTGHMSDVECLEFHPNAHYIATGSSDKQVRLWQIETGECVRLMFTVPGSVRSMKFTRNGLFLIAGNDTGSLVVFDLHRGVAIDVIQTCQQKAIWSIDVSWEDNLIAIGTEVGSIELYNFKQVLKAEQRYQAQMAQQHEQQKMQNSQKIGEGGAQSQMTSGWTGMGSKPSVGGTEGGQSQSVNQPIQPLLVRSQNPAFVRCYHSKMNGVQLVKFSWRNFLTTVGCIEKSYC